jgi:predicted RNA-binding protein YlxR (DUF448 family)
VGCGEQAAQAELVRFVAADGALVLDPRRRLSGRGAWVHRRPACWDHFVERRGAVRSLHIAPTRLAREALRDDLAAGGC